MEKKELIISKLEGYSGIRLLNNQPLTFKPGINLLVGRNGSGKSNLIHLINSLGNEKFDLKSKIESSYFSELAKIALRKKGGSVLKKFATPELIRYQFKGKSGSILLGLNEKVQEDFILNNLIQPGGKFHELITVSKTGEGFTVQRVNNTNSNLKFDIDGSFNSHPISKSASNSNSISSTVEDQIESINHFFNNKLTELLLSSDFGLKIKELEQQINKKLCLFLDNTGKRIELNIVSTPYPHMKSCFMDGSNEILPEYTSTGETVLLNLIYTLASVEFSHFDVLVFDEPEQHMHDDMIRIFFDEITQISKIHPDLIILVASHSTALIEYISSLGKGHVNLITFNNSREVKNSDDDIDFINALNRNGVWFSPLMLSKGQNIFIENQGNTGFEHRDFLLSFFTKDIKPNIIPIGTSGNVDQNDSFISVFDDILKTSNSKSIGIQDGDIWIKSHLTSYLKGDRSLTDLMELLQSQQGQYIKGNRDNRDNQYYFNFWEIENLYLMDELLPFWSKDEVPIDAKTYESILRKSTDLIAKQFIGMHLKKIAHLKLEYKEPERMLKDLKSRLQKAEAEIRDLNQLTSRTNDLIDSLITNKLWNWLPGKELKRHLENEGYLFDSSKIDFNGLSISNQLTSVLYHKRPDQ